MTFLMQAQTTRLDCSEDENHTALDYASHQAMQAAVYGRNNSQNTMTSLFARFGMSHLLCLSAWHVNFFKHRLIPWWLAIIILLSLMSMIGWPFPLLRAVIFFGLQPLIIHENRMNHLEIWSLSWLLALALSPFCWSGWSFWLSLYYGALFLYTKPSYKVLLMSNFYWIGLWGLDCDPISLVCGILLEPVFTTLFILAWLTFLSDYFLPHFFEDFWVFLFDAYQQYCFYCYSFSAIKLPFCCLLLGFILSPARLTTCIFRLRKITHHIFYF